MVVRVLSLGNVSMKKIFRVACVSLRLKYSSIVFLFLIIGSISACSGNSPTPVGPTLTARITDLQIIVGTNDFRVGRPRVPILLFDGTERVADAVRVEVAAFDLSTEPPMDGWRGEAINYSDYEVPYWVLYPELPHPGFWGIGAIITRSDGSVTKAEFVLEVVEESSSPMIGDLVPPSQNRTIETEPDLAKLNSGLDPIAGLYEITVAEAIDSGIPTVVTFATPQFCTSQLCAPVVDSVEAVYEEVGGAANFIHIEIFKDFETFEYTDEIEEWGLLSEPWTFVLDADGRVAAKFGGPVSPRELKEALEQLL